MLALALICVQHRVEVENALAAIAPWVRIVTRLGISILTVQCTVTLFNLTGGVEKVVKIG